MSIWIKYTKFSIAAGFFVTCAFKYINDTLGSIYTERQPRVFNVVCDITPINYLKISLYTKWVAPKWVTTPNWSGASV